MDPSPRRRQRAGLHPDSPGQCRPRNRDRGGETPRTSCARMRLPGSRTDAAIAIAAPSAAPSAARNMSRLRPRNPQPSTSSAAIMARLDLNQHRQRQDAARRHGTQARSGSRRSQRAIAGRGELHRVHVSSARSKRRGGNAQGRTPARPGWWSACSRRGARPAA